MRRRSIVASDCATNPAPIGNCRQEMENESRPDQNVCQAN